MIDNHNNRVPFVCPTISGGLQNVGIIGFYVSIVEFKFNVSKGK